MYYVAIGNYDRIKNYSQSAKYYDIMMGDRSLTANRIISLIEKHNKKAKSVLEVACGTGELIKFLKDKYNVEGMDKSRDMLEVARSKFPEISFMQGDMTKFYTDKKYDVVLCNFDSINHLTEFEKWIDFFVVSKNILNKNGILIFDINTLEKLEGMCTGSKSIQNVGDIDIQIEVEKVGEQKYNWQLGFFRSNTKEKLFEENILESSFEKNLIVKTLKKTFRNVEVTDFNKDNESMKNKRLYFICSV
jgi:ubiquinone/menaquinone biosynthesis C-methylase UbiE